MKRIISMILSLLMIMSSFVVYGENATEATITDITSEMGIVKGTLTFPEDAFLEGGSLYASIWAEGETTSDYQKTVFTMDEIRDYAFEIPIAQDETSVNIRIMIENLTGAYTNIYNHTSLGQYLAVDAEGNVSTEDWSNDIYIGIDELADMKIEIPTRHIVSGSIVADNYVSACNEWLTMTIGSAWTRALVNADTQEYYALMPTELTQGNYLVQLEKYAEENPFSNILSGSYLANNGESESVAINPNEDLTGIDFYVETGTSLYGSIKLPDDAVLEENCDIVCTLDIAGKTYYITGIMLYEGFSETNRKIPFIIPLEDESDLYTAVSPTLEVWCGTKDDMLSTGHYTNVVSGTYYYGTTGSTLDKNEAIELDLTAGMASGLVFELQTGIDVSVTPSVPSGLINLDESTISWADFYVLDENNEIIYQEELRFQHGKQFNIVLPKTALSENVYFMYKLDYSAEGTGAYIGKAFINPDGSIVGFRSDAEMWTLAETNTVNFTLAKDADIKIPSVINNLETDHPYLKNNLYSMEYGSNFYTTALKVKFSPKSWVGYTSSDYVLKITDGHGTEHTYTKDEFNQYISGEEIKIDGYEFSIEFLASGYSEDYGFAIVGVEAATTPSTGGGGGDEENANFTIKTVDTVTLEPVPFAKVKMTNEDETFDKTYTTGTDGTLDINLDDALYNVSAHAEGYQIRNFIYEKTEDETEFTIYLNKEDILSFDSSSKEMTREDMEKAGIDPDAVENQHIYKFLTVLQFGTESYTLNYICDGDKVLQGDKIETEDKVIYPVAKDIFLVIPAKTTWLKEMFDVQLIVTNTSSVETIENAVANLVLPEGLSLAKMIENQQTTNVSLGTIEPKGSSELHWYLCGDAKGEYYLDGTATGKRTAGGISEDIAVGFKTKDAINVLAGDALHLLIEPEKTAVTGELYKVKFTLQNVSKKPVYNLALNILGGKFLTAYDVSELDFDPDTINKGILNGDYENGFTITADELQSGETISGIFEIVFGKDVAPDGIEYMLKNMFVFTGAGSTTEIPTDVVPVDEVIKHNWDSGTVTTAATCTEDGIMTYSCTDVNCTETMILPIPAIGHEMGDWETETPQTCTTDGNEKRICIRENCTYFETRAIPNLGGHKWETEFTIDKEATCTEDGSKSKHCSQCDEKSDIETIPATDHKWGEWIIEIPQTCTTSGSEKRVCLNAGCTHFETNTLAVLGHNWNTEFTVDKEATCKEEGSKSIHCLRCDAVKDTTVIPKAEHSWDDGVVEKQPTETETGSKLYTCTVCSETKTETLPKLVYQELEFTVSSDITYTYGDRKYVENEAYNDSTNPGKMRFESSNTEVATVDENGRATILNSGETTITAIAEATSEYLETRVSYKLIINKAPLTVKPVDKEIFYGETPVFDEFEAEGLKYEDTKEVVTGEAVYGVNYNIYDACGDYAITLLGLDARNYIITYSAGKLTVKKAENYTITLGNLSQRKDSISAVTTTVDPKDTTAEMKIVYKATDGSWVAEIPTEIGKYQVRASLISSDNIVIKENYYSEAELEIKAGAMIDLDGNNDLGIDSTITGNNVEFTISDEDVQTLIDNVPSTGEVVINAKGNTGEDVNNITLPANLVEALKTSEDVESFTVLTDAAEITMDTNVLTTVVDKIDTTSKINVTIDGVDKTNLNEQQQAALEAINGGDDTVVVQLNLDIHHYDENGNLIGTEPIHALGGGVKVRAAYSLPADFAGKKIKVCYVADDGSVSFVRAKYEDGFISFDTDHFSHYALFAAECTHTWNSGEVITEATTSSTGLKRYTCTECFETNDETIPKKTSTPSGNGGGGGGISSYTIKFETNGGSEIASVKSTGKAISEPTAPTKNGYTFNGWYTDKELTSKYDFSNKITKSFTLYAAWVEKSEQEQPTTETKNPFADINIEDWFYNAVMFAYENNITSGISETEFAPQGKVTRGQFITMLCRAYDIPEMTGDNFDDCGDTWYTGYLAAAKQLGISNGVGDNKFAPEKEITREEMVTLIYNYLKSVGKVDETANETSFADDDMISEWAKSAVAFASSNGYVNGKDNNMFDPQGTATRAELAQIFYNILAK